MTALEVGTLVTPSVRLVRPLRDGGMGSVWIAHHLGLQTEVVVKFIAPELADNREANERFDREAAAAAQVKSPHVVQVFDHGVNAEYGPYIVMELLVGEDLGSYLKHTPSSRLPPREVAALVGQVAKALARAHAVGIIHRDIKPENIFLCDADGGEAFVKLLDFGIAKGIDHAGTSTTAGQVMGTPFYMSPEQLLAEPIDPRTDIWALGVVAFEAVTGKRPFRGETIGALTLQIHSALPVPSSLAPDVPPAFDEWFRRACCKDLEGRFQNAREAAQALYDACLDAPPEPKRLFSARPPMMSLDLGVGSSPDHDANRPRTELSSTSNPAPAPKRDRRATLALFAAAALIALALAAFAVPRSGPPTIERPIGASPIDRAHPEVAPTVTPSFVQAPLPQSPSENAATAVRAPSVASITPPATPTTSPLPSAAASAKPAKVSLPRPQRPVRPRDGFDDIK